MRIHEGLFVAICAMAAPSHGAAGPGPHDAVAPSATGQASGVLELRRYTLHPFKRDVLIDLFEREFVESQEEHGIRLVGTFRDLDAPDRFVWLRGFADMESRTVALAAFYDGPAWRTHRDAANRTMIDSDDVLLLRPVWTAASFDGREKALRPRDAVDVPPGIVVATMHDLRPERFRETVESFEREALPALRDAGIDVVAVLATESARNGFPRLPVREDAHVLVWLAQYPDADAHARAQQALSSHGAWRRIEAGLDAAAPAEILRLQPTPRSRLPAGR